MNTGECKYIYTRAYIRAICTGPAGFILGVDNQGHIMQLRWKKNSDELELVHSIETNITNINYMCYVEHNDAVVLSCWYPE